MTRVFSNNFNVNLQATAAPFSYLQGMGNYLVRALTGSFAPVNGNATLFSATPVSWQNEATTLGASPGGGNIIDFWSGGDSDPANSLLYCFGGGHNNSYNNGIYTYDFKGSTKPTGFNILAQSLTSAVVRDASTYSDGKCSSRHTYCGSVLTPTKFYQFGGAQPDNGVAGGGFLYDAMRFTLGGAWAGPVAQPSGLQNGAWTLACYDPNSNKIFVLAAGSTNYAIYRCATEAFSSVKFTTGTIGSGSVYATLIYVPTNATTGRIFIFGQGINTVLTMDWTAETATNNATHVVSGAAMSASASGPGAVYDSVRNCIWLVSDNSGVTKYDIATNTATTNAFASGSATMTFDGVQVNQTYRRLALIGNGAALGIITNYQQPAYVIKLP